ncbi:MAG: baseplate J/gp47 family protein [Spirochaetaceae bacterium]|jgi:uncharacterized phage protein gp47/JayE|nr:baseplate J/gp47 family protein [Spirochaetaceae bacterium]
MEVKSFDQIYGDMKNYIIAHQDRITDFNDGSVLSSQIEALARELALLYAACQVGFSSFLRSLPYSVFDFRMKEGARASTQAVFSRSKPFSYETPIPAGTVVAAGSLNFLTTEAGSVAAGETASSPVAAVAQNTGDRYNISAGTIGTIVSTLSADIVKVSNPVPAAGGVDSEDWAAYVDRFADYILGLSRTNTSGILSGLNSGHLIRSMSITEHFPPLDGIWNMTLYLEDGSGGITPDALAEAKRIIDGDLAAGIGGYRAPGLNIRYLAPQIIPVTTHVTVHTERDIANEIDESVIANMVIDATRKWINGLKIGQSFLVSDLIVVLRRISVLSNARVTYPADDIAIQPNQTARYGDCVVTVVT